MIFGIALPNKDLGCFTNYILKLKCPLLGYQFMGQLVLIGIQKGEALASRRTTSHMGDGSRDMGCAVEDAAGIGGYCLGGFDCVKDWPVVVVVDDGFPVPGTEPRRPRTHLPSYPLTNLPTMCTSVEMEMKMKMKMEVDMEMEMEAEAEASRGRICGRLPTR